MRSLGQWLAHQSQVHPQAIELNLARLRAVLERLRWRQPTIPVITVAGTNGKGSVTAYCAAILGAAGYRVGVFTSPHLRDYRERIRINDRWVAEAELLAAFAAIEAARLGSDAAPEVATSDAAMPQEGTSDAISLTYFEYNALAAFLVFQRANLDAWILEVGMGGRLDAVNVIEPSVAVVVSIGLDHQEFLGNTLEAIALEKAGIFRRGRSAVLGNRDLPKVLLGMAESIGAVPKRLGIEYDCQRDAGRWQYRGVHWNLADLPPPALAGAVQYDNAATAIAALEEIQPVLPISAEAVARGLESVRLTGRFQIIAPHDAGPTFILDVAHNPAAARVLAHNLNDRPCRGRSLAVCGILADKDAPGIAAELHGCFEAWWLASTDGVRGTSAAQLAQRIVAEVTVPLAITDGIGAACAAAYAVATGADRIVVFGSFHTVGPALDWLDSQGLLPPSAAHLEYT